MNTTRISAPIPAIPCSKKCRARPEQQETWKQNRLYSYAGSRLHFIRSWYDSTLKDEGFVLEIAGQQRQNKMTTDAKTPMTRRSITVDSGDVEISSHGTAAGEL